jgi:hypothetical protein
MRGNWDGEERSGKMPRLLRLRCRSVPLLVTLSAFLLHPDHVCNRVGVSDDAPEHAPKNSSVKFIRPCDYSYDAWLFSVFAEFYYKFKHTRHVCTQVLHLNPDTKNSVDSSWFKLLCLLPPWRSASSTAAMFLPCPAWHPATRRA